MKQLILLIFTALTFSASAQFVITSSTIPVPGDINHTVDTYSTGLTIPASGINQLWNYTGIAMDTASHYSATYTPVSSAPNASLFPSATIAALNEQGDYEMYSISSSTLGYVGLATATASDCSVFSNSILFMTFPFTYGNSFTDNFAVNNSQYSMTGTLSNVADGTGTLALPGYTFSNVLKATLSFTQNVTVGTSNFIVKSMNHNFYSSASKFALFTVISQTTATSSSTVTDLYGQVNNLFVIAGIRENGKENSFDIFPNPLQSQGTLILKNIVATNTEIVISDITGKIVKQQKCAITAGEGSIKIDCRNIPPGVYSVRILSPEGVISRKLLIE